MISGQNLDTISLNKHLQELDEIWDSGDYRKGIAINSKMLEKVSKTDSNALRELYRQQGRFYMNLGIMDSILPNAKKAYGFSSRDTPILETANYLNLIGAGFYRLNQMDSAEVNYLKSFELKKRGKASNERMAVSCYNLAIFYVVNSRYDKADFYGTNALDYLKYEKGEEDFKADIYSTLAGSSLNRGDLTMAQEYSNSAISFGVSGYGTTHPRMGLIYLGAAAISGELDEVKKAVEYNEKAIGLIGKHYGERSFFLIESLVNLAVEYEILGHPEKAIACYQRASEIAKFQNDSDSAATVDACWADFLISHDPDNPEIELKLLSALEEKIKTFGNVHLKVSEVYLRLAKYHRSRKAYEDAFLFLDKAKQSIGDYEGDEKKIPINPRVAIQISQLQMKIYLEQYFDQSTTEHLLAANNLVDPALFLAQNFVHDLSSEESIVQAQKLLQGLYEVVLETTFELYQSGSINFNSETVLKTFELGNSNSLFLSILESELLNKFSVSNETLRVEENCRKAIMELKEKLESPEASNFSREEISGLYEIYLDKQKEHDSLKTMIFASIPSYESLINGYNAEVVSGLLNDLNPTQQITHYFFGERHLYQLILSKGNLKFIRKSITDKNKNDLQNLISSFQSKGDVNQSQGIYEWLGLNELDKNKTELLIIPNNILGYVAFETLRNKDKVMLLESYSISYAPSLQLVHQLSQNRKQNQKSWAGFLADASPDVQLNAATDEVIQLSDLLGGDVFQGLKANSKTLFEAASSYDIIHLALHSKADANNPLFSKIYFDDEVINASDIYGSSISSKMVVLSSCESGYGQLKKGEGVMSLSRAFTYAGASSTVVSLWEVPDKETARIMTLFYQHLKQGKAKDVALRDAKLEYLNTADDALLKHPYYWAGFVVTGDTSPLFSKNTFSRWVIVAIVGLVLVGFIGYRRKHSVEAA